MYLFHCSKSRSHNPDDDQYFFTDQREPGLLQIADVTGGAAAAPQGGKI